MKRDENYEPEMYPAGEPGSKAYARFYRRLTGAKLQFVDACSIEPPHWATDEANEEALRTEMARDGWRGRPLLVMRNPNAGRYRWKGLTGSHRRKVACARKMQVPVLVLDDRARRAVLASGVYMLYFAEGLQKAGLRRLTRIADLGGRRRSRWQT